MEQKILVLSALLHDIGEFAQRAKQPGSKDPEGDTSAHSYDAMGHPHAPYTDHFIKNELPLPADLNDARSRIAGVAACNGGKAQGDLLAMSLAIADCLSNGSDGPGCEARDSGMSGGNGRLVSIFDEIELINHRFKPPGEFFHRLAPLDPGSDDIFPSRDFADDRQEDYPGFFELFKKDLRKIDAHLDFRFYLDGLISILEKYTWCIPSASHESLPGASLFDHSFSAAGIAQALFLYHQHYGGVPGWDDDNAKFILFGGDLSGIQEYIFGISKNSGRGVSKIFRARSFFLQALTRSVIIDIQNRFGLLSPCRLMDSGGKFILLLPRIDRNIPKLEELEKNIHLWFLEKFKGMLTMNVSWSTRLTQVDFSLQNFHSKIDEINESLERSKYQKLKYAFSSKGPVIDGDYDEREGRNCSLCGVNAADSKSSGLYAKMEGLSEEQGISVCSDCCQQIVYIGTYLPRYDYIIYGEKGEIPLYGDIHLSLKESEPLDLNGFVHVETLADVANFCKAKLARHLPRVSKEELLDSGWLDLLRKEEERGEIREGQPKTFNMIAQKSKKRLGDKHVGRGLLGFLKADVDNMGLLFSLGLRGRLSSARFSSVSRMLHFFFSDILVKMVQKKFPDIYVVFAGGDDLIMVGPWSQVIPFAIHLRKKLSDFCAQNPDITLSGGILAGRPRLPMRKAVELVEHGLEEAKKTIEPDRKKDSVSFLDKVLSWKKLEELMTLGKMFDKAVEEKERTRFSTAFLHRLLHYHGMYMKFTHGRKDIQFGRYLALAYYDIGRNIQGWNRNNQKELDMLYEIFEIGVDERPLLENLHIPLFYAINLNREKE